MQGSSSPWYGRRVLVTGCSGFLGAAVTRELLYRQAHVIGLMRDRNAGRFFAHEYESGLFHIAQGQLEDTGRIYTILAVHEVSAIFHLIDEPAQSDGFGLPAGINRIADDPSTAAILRATALLQPRLPVIVARPSSQLRLLGTGAALPNGIARFGELFGPDDSPSHFVPQTITKLLAGERIAAPEGLPRDFVFIRDAARACLSLAEAVGGGSEPLDITFRSGWGLNDTAMVEFTSDLFYGREPNPSNYDAPSNPFGWQPAMSFSDAVAETIEWHREYRSRTAASRFTNQVRKAA